MWWLSYLSLISKYFFKIAIVSWIPVFLGIDLDFTTYKLLTFFSFILVVPITEGTSNQNYIELNSFSQPWPYL